jgi:hypothetical protein
VSDHQRETVREIADHFGLGSTGFARVQEILDQSAEFALIGSLVPYQESMCGITFGK